MAQPIHAWQIQEAKARFSELIRLVRSQGPQTVTFQGKKIAVVVPIELFNQFNKRRAGPKGLVEFFQKSPLAGLKLNLDRRADYGRDVKL